LRLDLGEDVAALLSMADVRVVAAAGHPEVSTSGEKASAESKKSTGVDFSSTRAQIHEPLRQALIDLGYTKTDAAHKLEAAWEHFEGRSAQPTEGELLYEAFRA
jgi:hypothetical protein